MKKYIFKIVITIISLTMIMSGATSLSVMAASSNITTVKAKQIALTDANLGEDEVIFITSELESSGTKSEYRIEFCHKTTEYIYIIDAKTGSITSFDQDDEYYINPGAITSN